MKFKATMMWFYYTWESFMSLKYNPFRFIGDISMQMYLMVALSIVWTACFCSVIAGWSGVIPLIYGHVLTIFALFMTYATFKDAEKNNALWITRWKEDYNLLSVLKRQGKNKNICRWDLEKEA